MSSWSDREGLYGWLAPLAYTTEAEIWRQNSDFYLNAAAVVALRICSAHKNSARTFLKRWKSVQCGLCFMLACGSGEIFPLETRALDIACFCALGTAIGGSTSPLLFGWLIESGSAWRVTAGYALPAGLLLIAAGAELMLGIDAEGNPSKASPIRYPVESTKRHPASLTETVLATALFRFASCFANRCIKTGRANDKPTYCFIPQSLEDSTEPLAGPLYFAQGR